MSPSELAEETRLAAAICWFSQGLISQGKAAEIAGLSRAEFLEELAGLRNRIVHGYFGLDLEIIWQVIRHDLPQLRVQLEGLA